MAVTIGGANTSLHLNSGYGGPFKAPNGFVYFIARESGVLRAWKGNAARDAFVAQDTAGEGTPVAESHWCYLLGEVIHCATTNVSGASDTDVQYHAFDTSSDTWTTVDETIVLGIKGVATQRRVSLAVRSDEDVIVLYQGDPDKDMGADKERVDYARKEVGWTINIDVGGTTPAGEHRTGGVVVRGSLDNMHFVGANLDATNDIFYRTLDSTNNLSTLSGTSLMTTPIANLFGPGIAWLDGATWRVAIPLVDTDDDSANVLRFAESSGDIGSPGQTTFGSPEDVYQVLGAAHLCAARDGDGRMYVMWSGGGAAGVDQDLYRDDSAAPYTTWSGETEVIDATTIGRISCSVFPIAGAIKLAYIYDDGASNPIKYDEVALSAPTAPAMADSRFPVSGRHKIGPFSV